MADVAALVVALSAQLSQFQKDMEKAGTIADSAVKGIEESFSKMNPDASGALRSFSDSAQQPAQAAGASIGQAVLVGFTGAIALIITRLGLIVDGLAKIGDRAEDLRLPVNLLQALSVAADEARLPQENLNKALDQFTKVSKQTREDAEAFYKALSNIGEGFATAFEKAPTQAARLEVVRNALRSTTDEVKRAQLLLEAFKTDSPRAFQVFADSEGLDKAQQKLKALGLEIDETAVQKAQEARSQLSLLAKVLTDELSSALAGLIPTFVTLLPYMKALSATAKDVIAIFQAEGLKGISTLETEAATLGQQIKELTDQYEKLGMEVEEPKTSLKKAGEETKQTLQQMLIEFGIFSKEELETTQATIAAERDRLLAALDVVQQRIRELRRSGEAPAGPPTTGQGGAFKGRPSLTSGDESDAFDKQVDSINRHIAALNADAAAIGKTVGQHEQLRAELQLLQAIERSEGEVTQEQIDRYGVLRASMTQQQALTAAGISLNKEHADSFNTVSQRMLQAASAADQAKKNYAGLQSAIQFGGNQLIDIMDGLRNKTLSASDAMKNLTNNLLKALEQALLLGGGPLAGLLGTQSAVTGGTGGLLGGLFNSFSGPKATGGGVSQGRSYLVGEHGPELFMPNTSGNIFPNSVSGAGGSGTSVEINNFVAADTETKQTQQQGPDGERIIIDIVKKAQARGDLDAGNRSRFGLRVAKVR